VLRRGLREEIEDERQLVAMLLGIRRQLSVE